MAAVADEGEQTVVFFHPDLGIGGAERLVVDAAVGLQQRGHKVVIFTNHCDPGHCFEECRNGTLDVRVRGSWLIPPSLFARLTILCAILRHIHLLLTIHFTSELASLHPSAFFVDQLSAGLPLLQYLHPSPPIFFYCHFPDLLLARGRDTSLLKRLYRVPFDWLEGWSMGFAAAVAVNSQFTKAVVERTWPRFRGSVKVKVVYPCVDVEGGEKEEANGYAEFLKGERVVLSINRFERKKDVALAIKAFAAVPEPKRRGVRLVIAGGFDSRILENTQYHTELQALCDTLSLPHSTLTSPSPDTPSPPSSTTTPIFFLLSVPSPLKTHLLHHASLLIYTPSEEHFGIVPLEAMLARLPVLAASTGGPVETILDGQTGWLRAPGDVQAWSGVVQHALGLGDQQRRKMGERGRERVRREFGREKMAERIDTVLEEITTMRGPPPLLNAVLNFAGIGIVFVLGLWVSSMYSRAHKARQTQSI